MWISGWTTTCLFCLIQPFMNLWVGKEYLFDTQTVLLFCLYYFLLKLGDIRTLYVQGAGLYWQQRYRAIGESLANIILNWILARYFGVIGIIAATIISLFIFNYILSTQIVFKHYFTGISVRYYHIQNLKYFLATLIGSYVTYKVTAMVSINGVPGFFVLSAICCIVPNLVWMILFGGSKEYSDSLNWVLSVIKMEKLKKYFIRKKNY